MMRNKQSRSFLIVMLLLLAGALIVQLLSGRNAGGKGCAFDARVPVGELAYVDHARCRMHCREIDRGLVEEVYLEGSLNCDKSDPEGKRGGNPRYALEKQDGRRGRVRLIVEDDDGKHLVITVIRLDEEDKCDCS